MSSRLILSIDAMGGDYAPDVVIEGLKAAHVRYPDASFIVFGDEARLRPLFQGHALEEVVRLHHTDEVVASDAKPSQALRGARKSSMGLAVQAVRDGEAQGIVSAGNTGALMALSKFLLRTLPGIDRPAITTMMPTQRGDCVMLDLGANTVCSANNLVEFAIMGTVFARCVLGLDEPIVGLLNIGTEDGKGRDEIGEAARILRASPLANQFHGFVEGGDLGRGTVDVVVSDGFTGNVALKVIEGTAFLVTGFIREAYRSSLLAKIGYVLSRPALAKARLRSDPRRYNGAMFLGLDGIAVKSHGGTDAFGFANAVGVAHDLVVNGFNDKIKDELMALYGDSNGTEPEGITL